MMLEPGLGSLLSTTISCKSFASRSQLCSQHSFRSLSFSRLGAAGAIALTPEICTD